MIIYDHPYRFALFMKTDNRQSVKTSPPVCELLVSKGFNYLQEQTTT